MIGSHGQDDDEKKFRRLVDIFISRNAYKKSIRNHPKQAVENKPNSILNSVFITLYSSPDPGAIREKHA